ncbi:hypothetical protein [Niallia sp. 03133]|uniref:hypothetical protein n=1 Tax=Niallia sp. 03133 TaxID=3458060 RepID=UPI0040449D4F
MADGAQQAKVVKSNAQAISSMKRLCIFINNYDILAEIDPFYPKYDERKNRDL